MAQQKKYVRELMLNFKKKFNTIVDGTLASSIDTYNRQNMVKLKNKIGGLPNEIKTAWPFASKLVNKVMNQRFVRMMYISQHDMYYLTGLSLSGDGLPANYKNPTASAVKKTTSALEKWYTEAKQHIDEFASQHNSAIKGLDVDKEAQELKKLYDATVAGNSDVRHLYVSRNQYPGKSQKFDFQVMQSINMGRSYDTASAIKNLFNTFFGAPENATIDRFKTILRNIPPETRLILNAKYFKSLVRMAINKIQATNKHAEAPESAPLGKIAFAPERLDIDALEKNTPKEDNLKRQLYRHFDGGAKINASAANLIKRLLKQGIYEPVFHKPDVTEVQRGMTVKAQWLATALGKTTKTIPKKGSKNKSFVYKPKGGKSSSWTVSKQVANRFAHDNTHKGDYTVIMYAKVSQNKDNLLSPKGMYKLDFAEEFKAEKEVVGLGDIKVYKIEWKHIGSRNSRY